MLEMTGMAAVGGVMTWWGVNRIRRFHLQKMIMRYRVRAIARGFGRAFDRAIEQYAGRCAAGKRRMACWEVPHIFAATEAAANGGQARGDAHLFRPKAGNFEAVIVSERSFHDLENDVN